MPMDQIDMNIKQQIEVCKGAPFYVLGPLVTDIAPGYDHITSAIGAALAGWSGAAMLCYVTPKEHLGLPDREDVKQGVIAYRSPPTRPTWPGHRKEPATATTRSAGPASPSTGTSNSACRSIPKRPAGTTTKRCRQERSKVAHFCSMCGPKYCSMKITQQVREYARTRGVDDAAAVSAGMEEKALEFRKAREIYIPVKN